MKVKVCIIFIMAFFVMAYNLATTSYVIDVEDASILYASFDASMYDENYFLTISKVIINFIFNFNIDNPLAYYRGW